MKSTAEIRRLGGPLLQDFLLDAARERPDAVALVEGDVEVTFGEVERRSRAVAAFLTERGVARGDRVIVFGDNSIDTVVAFWSALRADAVVSVVSPQTKADKLAYLLDDCRASALFADRRTARTAIAARGQAKQQPLLVFTDDVAPPAEPEKVATWAEALAEVPAELPRRAIDVDLASIIYTSGSTGLPKGVMLTHRNMISAAVSVSTYLEMAQDDVVFCALPLSFDYGLYQVIMSARVGATVVIERSFAYPAQAIQVMQKRKVTGFPGVPTMFALLQSMDAAWKLDWSSIRYVSNTAAALSQRQIGFLRELFKDARVYSMYGLTECHRCTYLPPADLPNKPGSVGLAIPNTEMWIVDDDGRRLAPTQVGELVIRGSTVMRGYWEKPEATQKRLRPGPLPGEMVLYTGDLCRMDEDGYLYFVGRMDDIIKSRGEKVAPKEVENALNDLDGVLESAVIGVEDPVLGQAVKAFVVLRAGATLTAAEVQRACSAKLESFMVPKYVEIIDELPKTTTGKIKKTDLR
ncbi:MAG: acyl--CoA ligase [Myxococcales bacterium]|nr:acyl--CoA ligase [Myxococcales bacterium]